MALPSGYNARALSPSIEISDLDDTEQFTFISKSVNPAGTRDFNLQGMGIHAGVNDDHGNCMLIIHDAGNIMTNNDVRRASSIKRQWNLKVNLGKGVTGDRWFHGKVLNADIIRPSTGEQYIRVFSGGWGMRALERISKIERIQKRETSGGEEFDDTDTSTTINALVNDIWQDQDHYVLRSLGLEPSITLDIQNITTPLTEFKDYYQSWSFLMSRLAAVAGAVWGIDANREVYFRSPISQSSGILLSGDESNVITQKWMPSNLCYITGPIEWTDSTGESGYSVLHAPGATRDSLDVSVNPTVNADFNLSSNWLAIEWTAGQDTLSKIAAKFKKVGTPASGDAFFQIVGEASGGGPRMSDVRKKVRIPLQVLTSFPSTNPDFFKEYSFEKIKVTPDEKLYCVFEKYGDGSNHYVLQYASGGALTYYTSTNGVSWSSNTGDFAFRTYPTRTLNVVLYNAAAARRFGTREKVVDLKNIADIKSIRKVMIGLADIMGKEKRLYKPITTTVPDSYIQPGQTLKILDTYGLNTQSIILGWDVTMSATNADEKLGASEMTWNLGEFY